MAKQPDFVADEIFFQFEPRVHGGFSLSKKLAKKGSCYRSEDYDGGILFFRPDRATVYYNPRKKFFREIPLSGNGKWYDEAIHVEHLVNNENLSFAEVGTETVDGHDCLKIKITKQNGVAEEPTVLVFVAKDLHNLVILVEVSLSDRTNRFMLRNISLEVPPSLFEAIEKYNGGRAKSGA